MTTSRARDAIRAGEVESATTPQQPTTARTAGAGGAPSGPSPHYSTSLRSRHSLYGTEDRVVFDIGSSIVKAGFSGEPAPRECRRSARGRGGDEVWGLEKGEPTEDEWLAREYRLRTVIRSIWFENLLTDPRTRKIIVAENPLLSTRVKEMIARVLFDNLQVPSLSFASAPVLALMASGRLSGLVVDVGHLETTVTPVFHSRPLFPCLATSPNAGRRLNRRLRAMLLAFATYIPPPTSLAAATPASPADLPRGILTDELVEEIKTRLCFVGEEVLPADESPTSTTDPGSSRIRDDLDMSDEDEAIVTHLYERYSWTAPDTKPVSFRVPTSLSGAAATTSATAGHYNSGRGWIQVPGWVRERAAEVLWEDGRDPDAQGLADVVLECLLRLPTDLRKPMASAILVTGGTAMLPGFFSRFKSSLLARLEQSHPPSPPPSPDAPPLSAEGVSIVGSDRTNLDEAMSVDPAESVTQTMSDTRSTSSKHGAAPSSAGFDETAKRRRRHALSIRLHRVRHSPHFAPLVGLAPHIAVLNHPCPRSTPSSSALARKQEGSAPSYSPALQTWVGASLAGALKTGGEEVTREMWDAAPRKRTGLGSGPVATTLPTPTDEASSGIVEEPEGWERGDREGRLPDWTRLV
ncbi:hypothetical protein JCM3774_002042 [Rhodotorula dairenensis]